MLSKHKAVAVLVLGVLAMLAAAYGWLLLGATRSTLLDRSLTAELNTELNTETAPQASTARSLELEPPPANIQALPDHSGGRQDLQSVRIVDQKAADGIGADTVETTFSAEAIDEALQQVRLDESGNVILDHEAMLALTRILGERSLVLDTLGIARLQELIQVALPDQAGSQVAQLAGSYYLYLTALREYDQLHAETNPEFDVRKAAIQRLRETYLGEEVAARLFNQSDAEKQYMYESFRLSSDPTLGAEDKALLKQQSRARYLDTLLSLHGWQGRYQKFQQERDRLLAESDTQGIAHDDTAQRVQTLFAEYFSEDEQEKMQGLQVPVMPDSDIAEATAEASQ